jgi:hypothetical protein
MKISRTEIKEERISSYVLKRLETDGFMFARRIKRDIPSYTANALSS